MSDGDGGGADGDPGTAGLLCGLQVQYLMIFLTFLMTVNLIHSVSSVADPDPHGSALKKASRFRIHIVLGWGSNTRVK